jgi:hypothetical protein
MGNGRLFLFSPGALEFHEFATADQALWEPTAFQRRSALYDASVISSAEHVAWDQMSWRSFSREIPVSAEASLPMEGTGEAIMKGRKRERESRCLEETIVSLSVDVIVQRRQLGCSSCSEAFHIGALEGYL